MAKLRIYNDIVNDEEKVMLSWNDLEGTTFRDVDSFISEMKDGDTALDLVINCRGGDYEQGMAIYDALRASGKEISARVIGQCSSIATLFLLAAKKGNRSATPNATILIHNPYIPAFTLADSYDKEDLQRIAGDLAKCTERLLDIYVDRTGADRERLREIMDKDEPMSAEQAKSLGFIDEIIVPKSAFNRKSIYMNKKSVKSAWRSLGVALGIVEDEKVVNLELETATGETLILKKEKGDPEVGDEVESPDGEYVMPDGSTIVVKEGVVAEIKPAESEDETAEEVANADETTEETATEETEDVEALKAEIEKLKEENAALKEENEKLKGEVKTSDERETLNMVAMAGGKAWLKRAKSEYKPAPKDMGKPAPKEDGLPASIADLI